MGIIACSLIVACSGSQICNAPPSESYLCWPAFCIDDKLRGPAMPYTPQAGDLFFSTDPKFIIRAGHWLAGTKAPHHCGIVFERPDGTMALIEAGPKNTTHIRVNDAVAAMRGYEEWGGTVYIRRRSTPLTPEQSARLTQFACAQDGKRFAGFRVLAQMTPLRCRGPLRTWLLGGPHGERRAFYCCELVLECCVYAGLLDPARTRPCATYPRDVFFGDSDNPFIHRHLDINSGWDPPSRWISYEFLHPTQ